jgi:hypothetical protein
VTTGKDPMIGRALDVLVPDFDVDPDGVLRAAHAGAASLRATRRRRRAVAAIAFAALLLFAGAAFAATKYDLLPFLHTNDKNTPGRTYHGAAPLALACPGARTGRFICHVTGPLAGGTRLYELGMRTDKEPLLTRQSMLNSLEHAQGVDPSQVAKVKSDLAAVDDDFIRALAILARIETVSGGGGSSGPNGTERVPPRGVPAWVACREVSLATFRCRPLAALVGVAGGTPLYDLQRSPDWRVVSQPPAGDPTAFNRALERLLGRKPNAAETRFMIDFFTAAAYGTGSSSGATKSTEIGSSTARSAALLAAHSLGARTGSGSAVTQPLPRRLPDGLARSGLRLYRVRFDVRAERRTLYVYVNRSASLHVWRVVWVAAKP